jgi:hypothetical protein
LGVIPTPALVYVTNWKDHIILKKVQNFLEITV